MVCRMRSTSGKRKSRRAHHGVTTIKLCKGKDGVMQPMHRMCYKSGMYKGRQVIEKTKKEDEIVDEKKTTHIIEPANA